MYQQPGQAKAAVSGFLDTMRDMDGEREGVQILSIYLRETPYRLSRLRRALDSADGKGVDAALHSMKGSAGVLGMRTLYRLLCEADAAAADGDLDHVEELWPKIETRQEELLGLIVEAVEEIRKPMAWPA